MIEAARLLAAGDDDAALARVVEVWWVTRAPAVAELVEALSARIAGEMPVVPPRDLHRTWMAIAAEREPRDLPRLFASLLVPNARFGVQVVADLAARVAELASFRPDPRTGAAVLSLLRTGGYEAMSTSNQPAWRALLDLLLAHADPRVTEPLAALRFTKILGRFSDRKKMAAWLDGQVADTVGKLRALRREPGAVDPAACAKVRAAIAKRPVVTAAAHAARDVEILAAAAAGARPAPLRRAVAPARPAPSSTDPAADLAAAARALDGQDDHAALRALLSAWRGTRARPIAELVELASARCARPPIDGADRKAIQASWLAIAATRDPADWPRLLASLVHTHKRATDARLRFDAIADWPADPRTARGVVALLQQLPFYASSTRPLWRDVIALVVAHGDPRAAAELAALRFDRVLPNEYGQQTAAITWFTQSVAAAVDALRFAARHEVVLTPGPVAACARLRERLVGPREQLLAAVAADLDDDAPRAVYADWLQELGDPRGELIALQLARREPARQAALLAEHGRAWLGELAGFADLPRCRFERGFLVAIALDPRTTNAQVLESSFPAPEWTTVLEIDAGHVDRGVVRWLRDTPLGARTRITQKR